MSEVHVDNVRYRVDKTVMGGMGQVWLLSRTDSEEDPVYRSRLAVKTFDSVKDQVAVANELDHWISLDHDGVVPLLKIGRLNYQTAALMPWRVLGSLGDLLSRRGPLHHEATAAILLQTLRALDHAVQKHSLLHLDVKPANILLRSVDPLQIEVSDWGISRLASSDQTSWFMRGARSNRKVTQFGAGTLPYMAPERLQETCEVDKTADIYSAGMMALEMMTGRLPFTSVDKIIDDIVSGIYFSRAMHMAMEFPSNLAVFCECCLNPNPRERPRSYSRAIALLL